MGTLTPEEQAQKAEDAATLFDSTKTFLTVWEQWHTKYRIFKGMESSDNVLKWLQAERKAYGGACSFAMRWGYEPEVAILVWEKIYKFCDAELTRLSNDEPPVENSGTKQDAQTVIQHTEPMRVKQSFLLFALHPIRRAEYGNLTDTNIFLRVAKAFLNENGHPYKEKSFTTAISKECPKRKPDNLQEITIALKKALDNSV